MQLGGAVNAAHMPRSIFRCLVHVDNVHVVKLGQTTRVVQSSQLEVVVDGGALALGCDTQFLVTFSIRNDGNDSSRSLEARRLELV
jgi:hypothetical protein